MNTPLLKNPLLLILPLLLFATGCRHMGGTRSRVSLGESRYTLQTPESFQKEIATVQQIRGNYRGRNFQYNLQSEITPHSWTTAGMTPVGFRVFLISMEGSRIQYSSRWGFRLTLPPNLLLAAWQFGHWPNSSNHPAVASGEVEIDYSGKTPWDESVRVTIPGENLEIIFTTLQKEVLSETESPPKDGRNKDF